MNRRRLPLSLAALLAPALWAQSAEGLRFEAVSIQPSTVDIRGLRMAAGGGPGTSDPGHVRLYGVSVRSLLILGFDLSPEQISGQRLTNPAFFDIETTLPRGTTKEQYKEMVRNLLADRFGLQYHIEKWDVSGYELTAEKRVKLKPAEHSTDAYAYAPSRGLLRRLDAHGAPELQPGRPGRVKLPLAGGGTRISGRMQGAADLVTM